MMISIGGGTDRSIQLAMVAATLLAAAAPVAAGDDSFESTVTQSGRDRLSEIVLDTSGPRLTLLARGADGVELLRVGWRDGFAFGKLVAAGDGLSAVFNESFDCESWIDEGRQERVERIATEALERLPARSVDLVPPPREIEAISTVALLRDLIAAACGTAGSSAGSTELPAAGGCYYDHRDSFDDCKQCCERADGVLEVTCGLAATYVCAAGEWVWCGQLGSGACAAITRFNASDCIRSDCSGLPGDSACPSPKPPCSGFCMNFCGIGWDSRCGACPGEGDEQYQTACCS